MLKLQRSMVEPVFVGPEHRYGLWARLLQTIAPAALFTYFALSPQPAFARDPFGESVRHHLIFALCVTLWLAGLIVRRRLPKQTPFDLPLLVLLTTAALAMVGARDSRLSLEPILNLVGVTLLFYVLADAPFLHAAALSRGLMLMALLCSLFALRSIWLQWQDWLALIHAFQDAGSSLVPPTVPRVSGVGSHPNILAVLLTMSVPLYARSILRSHGAARAGLGLALFLIEVAIFFTLARSAWVAQAVAWLVLVAALPLAAGRLRLPSGRILIAACAASAVAGVLVLALLLLGGRPGWLFRPSLAPRSDMRAAGMRIFAQHPWFGAGPGSYPLLYPREDGHYPEAAIHSHNVPVQIAAETGLAGLLASTLLAGTLGALLLRLWQLGDAEQRGVVAAVSASFIAFLVDGMGDSPHLFPEVLVALAALTALLLRSAAERERTDDLATSWWPLRRTPAWTPWALFPVLLLLGSVLFGLWLRIDQAQAHYASSLDLAARSRWQESADEAERAAGIDPTLSVYHVQAGVALEQAWQVEGLRDGRERGVEELNRALALEGRSGVTRLDLAALLASLGRNQDVVALLPGLVQDTGRDTLLLLGDAVLVEQLRPADAVETYAGLLVLNPPLGSSPFWQETAFRREHFTVIVARALARVDEVAPGSSGDSLREAIRLYSGFSSGESTLPSGKGFDARVARGRLLVARGDYNAAARLLRGAVAERPDDAAARLALGDLEAARDNIRGARRQWLAGAYLGDPESVSRLGNSLPAGAVPARIIELQSRALLDLSRSRFYLSFQHYRFAYSRHEPLPIVLPGPWLDALPTAYYEMQADLERWQAAAAHREAPKPRGLPKSSSAVQSGPHAAMIDAVAAGQFAPAMCGGSGWLRLLWSTRCRS